jgi:hypothetical protein
MPPASDGSTSSWHWSYGGTSRRRYAVQQDPAHQSVARCRISNMLDFG